MASKKITGMTEALSLENTDLLTGVDLSAAADSDKNVRITKSALGFAADDDPRLSDARVPTAHAGTHEDGGSDELALAAAQITDFQTTVLTNTKLAGIEDGATADQTAAEIKTAYESNANTNSFTDAEQTKLTGIEDGATTDQTAAEIKAAYESNANTNAFTDAEQTKVANALTSIPANAALNGYTELGTNLGAPAATATIPVDGKLYEFNAALTVDLVITVGTTPTAPTCASSVIYVKPGGNTVTFSGVDYWAGGEMPAIGTVMRYVISTTVTGDVLADGEAFEALP